MQYYRMNPRYKKTSSGQTMTVILDLTNSDPTQWATYADDAVGMTAGSDAWDDFFGHYPCILTRTGSEVGKLKRDNFAQYEDGTSAPITNYTTAGAFICFPRRGIKLEYIDANTLSISMTNEDNKEGYSYWAHSYSNSSAGYEHAVCDKFYLGVYKASLVDDTLWELSGQTPAANMTIGNFRTAAHSAHSVGFELSGFFQLTFRQVMYLLKYKGQNAQIAIGRGYVDGNSSTHVTGGTNTRGMDWGESTGQDQMKLFGLEDFYGNIFEFIDGIISDSNRKIYVTDGNFNDAGANYTDVGIAGFSSNLSGYLRYPIGTNLGGFVLGSDTFGGNEFQYFCDGAFIGDSSLGAFGGFRTNQSIAGPFRLVINPKADYSAADCGSRLMYMHVAS